MLAFLTAFLLSVSIYPFYIRWLKAKQIEQYMREDGPKSHLVKARTPTMGGLCFLLITLISTSSFLAFLPGGLGANLAPLSIVIAAALCGLVGLADDYGKVSSRSNTGISGTKRLACEFLIGLSFAIATSFIAGQNLCLLYVFDGMDIKAAAVPLYVVAVYLLLFVPFLFAATTNALNLHDGMDGLAGGTAFMVLLTMAAFLVLMKASGIALPAFVAAGALAGFLIYNRFPAKIFMGDTGSLFLGGLLSGLVVASGLALWFIPLALIYIVETLSVIAQVLYFKLTKEYKPQSPISPWALIKIKLTKKLPGEGKRLFRMAPIHHHFEAMAQEAGRPEWQVVLCFHLVQVFLCLAVLGLFVFLLVG